MDKLKALFEGEKEEPKKKGFHLPWVKEKKPDPKKGKFAGLKGMQTKMMEHQLSVRRPRFTGGFPAGSSCC